MVNFLQNLNKIHPIARPLERYVRCILCVQTLIYTLFQSQQWYIPYHVILERVITALECIIYTLANCRLYHNSNIPATEDRLWGTRWVVWWDTLQFALRAFRKFVAKAFNRPIWNCVTSSSSKSYVEACGETVQQLSVLRPRQYGRRDFKSFFLCEKIAVFLSKFNWNYYSIVRLTIRQRWFR